MKKADRKSVAIAIMIVFLLTVLAFPILFGPADPEVIEGPAHIEINQNE